MEESLFCPGAESRHSGASSLNLSRDSNIPPTIFPMLTIHSQRSVSFELHAEAYKDRTLPQPFVHCSGWKERSSGSPCPGCPSGLAHRSCNPKATPPICLLPICTEKGLLLSQREGALPLHLWPTSSSTRAQATQE